MLLCVAADGLSTNSIIHNPYVPYSGIYVEHNDFSGRAKWGFDVFKPPVSADGHGHGTHVAGKL